MEATLKKEKTKLRKSFVAVVNPGVEAVSQLTTLSYAMVHLWNIACDQAKIWLEHNQKASAKEERVNISAFSFNMWLTGVRAEKSVTLRNGEILQFSAISSDCEREVLRKLAGSYQSFFELKKKKDQRAREPRPQNPDTFMTLSWSSFAIKNGILLVPGIHGERIAIPLRTVRPDGNPANPGDHLERNIAGKKVAHATLTLREGRFQLNLITTGDLPKVIEHPRFFRAIDLGAGDIAVTDSDGSEFLIPTRRTDKYWMDQIAVIEGRQRLRTKGSRGFKRLASGRKKIHDIAGKQRTSHQRKVADAITEKKVECIILGKPRTRLGLSQSASGTPDQHYGVQNTGYMFRLLLFIKEKAEERGIPVIELPDPPRMGNLDDAQNKFFASRSLLEQGMQNSRLPIPTKFVQKKFHIDFGKGQPPTHKRSAA